MEARAVCGGVHVKKRKEKGGNKRGKMVANVYEKREKKKEKKEIKMERRAREKEEGWRERGRGGGSGRIGTLETHRHLLSSFSMRKRKREGGVDGHDSSGGRKS
jgi:hypothetical protein